MTSLTQPNQILIDGLPVPYQTDQSILQAALAAGLKIPHLCYHPELEPIGSCRLCLVEVDGRTLSACTLTAAEGQAVQSDSERLRKLRRDLLGMLLERGRHGCTRCERTGDCRLQEASAELDVPAAESLGNLDGLERDDSHPDVVLDRARCILCGICIQASRKLDGKSLFSFSGSGGSMRVTIDSPSGLLKDSAIGAHDHAVRLCPVGALVLKNDPVEPLGFSSFDFFD